MSFFTSQQFPNDPQNLPPARRRRARRLLAPLDADEKAAFLDELAHRTSPSFDFFYFCLIAGILISLGLFLDNPALLILGALIAPMMAPLGGLSLATVTGSIAFFFRSLVGLLIGCGLVFVCGLGGGFLGSWLFGEATIQNFSQAYFHVQLSWSNILVMILGSIWMTNSLVSGSRRLLLASATLAYILFVPLAAAGMGISTGLPYLWPDGLVVFAFHLSWSILIGAAILAILGYRPLTLFGYSLGSVGLMLGIILIIILGSAGGVFGGQMALPTPIPSQTPTVTLTITPSSTPVPPTASTTPTLTKTPTATTTITFTPSPTPIFAVVNVLGSDGVFLRRKPAGEVLGSYVNGTIVEVLLDAQEINGTIWQRIRTPDGKTGWVMATLLATLPATPTP
jgi:hypothetical protein